MDVNILTVRYSAAHGGIDDTRLQEHLSGRSLLSFREHLFQVGGVPHLACVVVSEMRLDPRSKGDGAREPETHRLAPTPASHPDPRDRRARASRALADGLSESDRPVFEGLRRWRIARARDEGVPPYVILTNRQLLDILRAQPTTGGGLGKIEGIGKAKVERYGRDILRCLHELGRDGQGEGVGSPGDVAEARQATDSEAVAAVAAAAPLTAQEAEAAAEAAVAAALPSGAAARP